MAAFAINPTGLKVKPTYESMTNYIANQPMIAYPDRRATMMARSQKMAMLFNENAAEMAQQQARAQQNQMMQSMATGIAQCLMGKGFGRGGNLILVGSPQEQQHQAEPKNSLYQRQGCQHRQ